MLQNTYIDTSTLVKYGFPGKVGQRGNFDAVATIS